VPEGLHQKEVSSSEKVNSLTSAIKKAMMPKVMNIVMPSERRERRKYSTTLVLLLLISTFYELTPANATPKITATPASFSLQEGTSATTTIALTEPIICLGSPCQVSLAFSSSDPSLVTFSPSTLTWLRNDWSQSRTLTITALADHTYKGNQSISVSATAASESEFYSGFMINVSVSTIEIDRSPAEIATQAAAEDAARKQRELTEILSLIPSIAGLSSSISELTNSLLFKQKCVKGKKSKFVKYGAKCPKGYTKKK
jgi:hypothetical protein